MTRDSRTIDRKKCNGCKKWKKVPDDFSMRRFRLRSGELAFYPATRCKQCVAKKSARFRSKWRKEGRYAELQAKAEANRDQDRALVRKRRWYRERRGIEGHQVRPWKRYRNELESPDRLVPRKPFDKFVSSTGLSALELSRLTGRDEKVFRDKSRKLIKRSTADLVFTKLGHPELVAIYYGS